MVRFTSLLLASAALALGHVTADDVAVHVRVHHEMHHAGHHAPATATRKVFQVTGTKTAFDAVFTPSMQSKLQLDVRRMVRVGGGSSDKVQADIAATDEAMASLRARMQKESHRHHAKTKTRGVQHNMKLHVKEVDGLTDEERAAQDRKDVAACLNATQGYQDKLASIDKYTKSAYFDCFRPYDEIRQFFDTMTKLNPQFVTKIENISTTYENRTIDAFKLSTSGVMPRRLEEQSAKKTVFIQSLVHAREWQGGASTHFTFASLLDDLRAGDAETVEMFDDVDWYFVPIVNADGYIYSWEVDRYWRVNRHGDNGYEGVDLNRNFPPEEYFNLDPSDVSAETYPGKAPLSEPVTRGLYKFILDLPNLIGLVDVHAYAGMVLRPFSDTQGEPEEPYGSAMKKLGDSVRDAMSPTEDGFQYLSQPSGGLYPAYGCIDDALYRDTNYTVPALTIEVEGTDFIAPQDTIRDVGFDLNNGLRRFVEEAETYHAFIEGLAAPK